MKYIIEKKLLSPHEPGHHDLYKTSQQSWSWDISEGILSDKDPKAASVKYWSSQSWHPGANHKTENKLNQRNILFKMANSRIEKYSNWHFKSSC